MNNTYPKRKPTRLKNYDYGSNGAYFITICTHNRKKLLSEIVGEGLTCPPDNTTYRNRLLCKISH